MTSVPASQSPPLDSVPLHPIVGRLLCVQCGDIRDEDDQDGAICNDCERANQEDYNDV